MGTICDSANRQACSFKSEWPGGLSGELGCKGMSRVARLTQTSHALIFLSWVSDLEFGFTLLCVEYIYLRRTGRQMKGLSDQLNGGPSCPEMVTLAPQFNLLPPTNRGSPIFAPIISLPQLLSSTSFLYHLPPSAVNTMSSSIPTACSLFLRRFKERVCCPQTADTAAAVQIFDGQTVTGGTNFNIVKGLGIGAPTMRNEQWRRIGNSAP